MITQWYSEEAAILFNPGFTIVLKGQVYKDGNSWIAGIEPFMNNSGAIIFQKKRKFEIKEEALDWIEDVTS